SRNSIYFSISGRFNSILLSSYPNKYGTTRWTPTNRFIGAIVVTIGLHRQRVPVSGSEVGGILGQHTPVSGAGRANGQVRRGRKGNNRDGRRGRRGRRRDGQNASTETMNRTDVRVIRRIRRNRISNRAVVDIIIGDAGTWDDFERVNARSVDGKR